MGKISKTNSPEQYSVFWQEANSIGDKNFCGPVAVAALTGLPITEVIVRFEKKGRKLGSPTYNSTIVEVAQEAGLKLTEIQPSDLISTYPKPHCTALSHVTTHHPRRFPASFPVGKRYMIFSSRHVSVVIDGVLVDWAVNNSLRATAIFEVE